ncbi:MAG: EAL domain-containing protein, partial [Porticoccaceae bacterium]|nr:EAL domain-containing protein [Porticoccaceae bacterium]
MPSFKTLNISHARHRGRYFYPRYRDGMQRGSSDQLELQNDLYRALERNELYVEYQPKLDAINGRILGGEALVRWQHGERGKISPAVFIPLAEANGLIDPIGEWVLCTAVTQSRFWQQEGMATFTIAVNLSGRQLRQQKKLVAQVRDILKQTGMPPKNLELEITETFLMEDIEESLALLAELKQLGIKLAIDDFGTGYSS